LEYLYFLIRRVFWSLLVLFGLSIVIFVIARVMPGDPARLAMGPREPGAGGGLESQDGARQTLG